MKDDAGPAAVQEVFLISDVDIQFFGEVPHVIRSPSSCDFSVLGRVTC